MVTPFFAFLPHGMDWLWLGLIVLVVFGPAQLPKLARSLGQSFTEFRKAKEEFEKELHSSTTVKLPEEQPKTIHTVPTIPASAIVAESELSKKS